MYKLLNILKEIKVTNKPFLKFVKEDEDGEVEYMFPTGEVGFLMSDYEFNLVPDIEDVKPIETFLKKHNIPYNIEGTSNEWRQITIKNPEKYFNIENPPVNEIKTIGKITPEMVYNIIMEKFPINGYNELENLQVVIDWRKKGNNVVFGAWLQTVPQPKLELYYKDILNKWPKNIQEIKTFNSKKIMLKKNNDELSYISWLFPGINVRCYLNINNIELIIEFNNEDEEIYLEKILGKYKIPYEKQNFGTIDSFGTFYIDKYKKYFHLP